MPAGCRPRGKAWIRRGASSTWEVSARCSSPRFAWGTWWYRLNLVSAFGAAHALLAGPPALEQSVLADFMAAGPFVRHVRRMRTLYAERQGVLMRALRRELNGLLDVPTFE